ncbi:MAG: 50S ribosomal protein L13 [Candidatus Helarchaeota archaeon]
MKTTIIDANGLILGRLASIVAKKLLLGERIYLINSEKVVISGRKREIIERYKSWLEKRTATAPWRGPLHPRRPDLLLKRTIRGMLPWKKSRGKEAYRRLKAFIGIPEELKNKKTITLENININHLKGNYMLLGDLAQEIGWTPLNKKV